MEFGLKNKGGKKALESKAWICHKADSGASKIRPAAQTG